MSPGLGAQGSGLHPFLLRSLSIPGSSAAQVFAPFSSKHPQGTAPHPNTADPHSWLCSLLRSLYSREWAGLLNSSVGNSSCFASVYPYLHIRSSGTHRTLVMP